jgi:hypothetical protein
LLGPAADSPWALRGLALLLWRHGLRRRVGWRLLGLHALLGRAVDLRGAGARAAAAALVAMLPGVTPVPTPWPPRLRASDSLSTVLRSSRIVASCSASARFIASSCFACSAVPSAAFRAWRRPAAVVRRGLRMSHAAKQQHRRATGKPMPCSERFFMTSSSPEDGGQKR